MQPMRLSLLALLLGQTALTLLPGAAMAQDATDLAAIHVKSQDQKSNGTGPVKSANAVTLTGSKTATPITEIPQSVTVVSHKELQAGNYQKLDAALSYSAGVIGQPYGYDTDTNWFNIRGFSATATGAYEDGLQNFSYGFGGFYIDPVLIQRVEVLKGASSVLYGGSNPGGLINFVSKYPTGKDTTAVELGADQHGGLWASVDANRRIDARTSYRLIAKTERVDGNGAFSPGFHGVVSGAVTRTLDNGGALTFGLDYTRVDEDHVGSDWLPYYGTVKPTSFGYIPRNFNTGEPDHDSYKRDQVMAHLHYTQNLGDWTFEDTARAGWSDVNEKSVYAYGYSGYSTTPVDADGTMSRLVFDQHTKTGTVLNDAHVTTTRQLGATQHTILLGFDFKSFYMDQMQASATGTALSFVDPQYGATQPAAVPYIDQTLHQTQLGLYAQDQIRWGKGWIATANLRNDWVQTSTGTNHATGVAGMSRDDSEMSWRLGIAKELPGGLVPYASVSSYFNPQIVIDSNGANTSPETGRQIEAGVKWAPNDRLLMTFAAFDLKRNNVSQDSYDATSGAYVYQQLGRVRSRGVEFEAHGQLTKTLSLDAAYTNMEVTVLNDIDSSLIGKTPYATPEQMAALKLSWQPGFAPGWGFSGGLRWMGRSWADNANTLAVPSYTLFDAGISYRFQNGWQANLAITNLADKRYVTSCQTAYWCFYGQERTASLTLRKTF